MSNIDRSLIHIQSLIIFSILTLACTSPLPELDPKYLGINDNESVIDFQDINHTSPFGQIISLDGVWQLEEGSMDEIPQYFSATAPVPGLVSNANPEFDSVGVPSKQRDAFWYKREFMINPLEPGEHVLIKIYKAKYGTKVWINGEEVGQNMYNFSPTRLEITHYLKQDREPNEVIIRVGAHIEQLPDTVTTGGEVEKFRYIPGIYDRIELVVVPEVNIEKVQIAADPNKDTVKLTWDYVNLLDITSTTRMDIRVYEFGTGALIYQGKTKKIYIEPRERLSNFEIFTIPGLKPWTPEDPRLYILEISDGEYAFHTRFGARTFRVDPKFTNRALLNENRYFFRGTNVSLFRFFEDPLCKLQPWDRKWVRKLHRKMKDFGMNSYRISISALPAFWFDIADEAGIAIFAEFPMWYALKEGVSYADFEAEKRHPQRRYGIYPEKLTARHLAKEYSEWMGELWNHASVIAWDAQNETWTPATGEAINMVRDLDLSNRPWDNGWSPPAGPADYREAHHYFARYQAGSEAANALENTNKPFTLADLPAKEKIPRTLYAPYQNAYGEPRNDFTETPCILNEYGYLWLNRDGIPTTLTKPYYDAVLGSNATPDERRYHYARMLAALTEYWRSVRTCFGVLHAFILGQSIPEGATSDNLIGVDSLIFDPHFESFVSDAFSPVSICIDYWEQPLKKGTQVDIPVIVTNDTDQTQSGNIHILISSGQDSVFTKNVYLEVEAQLQNRTYIRTDLPVETGTYLIEASLVRKGNETVRSIRDLIIVD